MSLKGIDVSTAQGTINWHRVADSGVEFAMIKATQGRGEGLTTKHLRRFTDSKFTQNITGATAAGIAVGVYHYMTAQTLKEAEDEADYFCDTIAPYRHKISLWAAVDVESRMYLGKLTDRTLTDVTKRFMTIVQQRGYKPMLYTNPDHLLYKFVPGAFNDAEIWLAHWMLPTGSPLDVPNKRIWQYGAVGTAADVKKGYATIASGRIPGINAGCDVNNGYFVIAPLKEVYNVGCNYTIKKDDVWMDHSGKTGPLSPILVGKTYRIIKVEPEKRILLDSIMTWVKI